jgi:dTDP-glucose 4,6-dehydratase
LLEVAKDYWSSLIGSKKNNFKFHHVSTDEVYGDLEGVNGLFTEETHPAYQLSDQHGILPQDA